ncbi:mechanosensitive ion channel family protein [Clostridium estertheticum]|uniref:mechanosensitive ion channel family protein n=1 Tax=Clostridium estertheticum TaxID=238834 RepID=UPI0028167482|nr:mechanosensitive ion channel domain-containing protein [Clostridium estertheticum]
MIKFLLDLGLKFETVGVLIKIIITIFIIMVFHLLKKSICSFINKSNFDSLNTIKYKKTSTLSVNILTAVAIIPIWMYESKDIFTFLGIFSAGLAFAFRDLVASFLGWLIINTHKPFKLGDRIKIGESLGDVVAIDWFYTTIIEVMENDNRTYGQSTGRITHIPNIQILTEDLINETNAFPFTWNELKINLTLTSNWREAKNILMSIADDKVGDIEREAKDSLSIASKTLPIYYENLSHTVYTSMESGSVCLNLRLICKARNFRNLQHDLVEGILDEFAKHEDIELL